MKNLIPLFLLALISCKEIPTQTEASDCMGTPQKDMVCNQIYDPVCGCDGKTYSNDCSARVAGVLRWTSGKCK